MESYFSFAKVILMGEYAVLHGADALCLPLKTGQQLWVKKTDAPTIQWQWSYKEQVLADFSLDAATLNPQEIKTGDAEWVITLIRLIRKQNPDFLRNPGHTLHFTNLFPPEWGLGSSSATISSLCRMAKVNPYFVNHRLMGGSGADIAATTMHKWFLYRSHPTTPGMWELPLPYHFSGHTCFIYSGNKQSTASHLKEVKKSTPKEQLPWQQVNEYVYRFPATPAIDEAMKIITEHESFIAHATGMPSIGNDFVDFPGKVKSLGAWGGDFFMALSPEKENTVKDYFHNKGFDKVFLWSELVNPREF